MPLAPDAFRQATIAAQTIEAVRTLRPGTLYVSSDVANVNILAHVGAPVRVVSLAQIGQLTAPALALLTPADVAALSAGRPDLRFVAHAAIKDKSGANIVEIAPH